MWTLQGSTNRWRSYVCVMHPGVHISVNVNDPADFHATNIRNQLHLARDGTASRGNAALRADINERYKLAQAIGSFMTGRQIYHPGMTS
jgi:hypothetical protein